MYNIKILLGALFTFVGNGTIGFPNNLVLDELITSVYVTHFPEFDVESDFLKHCIDEFNSYLLANPDLAIRTLAKRMNTAVDMFNKKNEKDNALSDLLSFLDTSGLEDGETDSND